VSVWPRAAAALTLLGALALAMPVRASTMSGDDGSGSFGGSGQLYAGSKLVVGDSAAVTKLKLATAGTLSIAIEDQGFTSALGALSFMVTDANGVLMQKSGVGTLNVSVSGPVALYVDVFAWAQGAANVGLYSMQISFAPSAPVPLPGAAGMLALALLGAWAARRRGLATYNCNTLLAQ
jgi:hypothetical protein